MDFTGVCFTAQKKYMKMVDKINKLLKPIIILYKPQLGENIGFVARAMRNCGVDDLRLIDPRDGWPNPLSYKVAKSGTHVLEKIKVFNKFIEAVKDVDYLVACSARKRNLSKETINPRDAINKLYNSNNAKKLQNIGFIFGPENSGLENNEISYANIILNADLNKNSDSLNLAQAVLIICWEWWMKSKTNNTFKDKNFKKVENLTTVSERTFFFDRIEDILQKKGFYRSENKSKIIKQNLRSFFTKANPTKQELKTLHGIFTLFEK